MLYEDDVVDALCQYLAAEGWRIEQRALAVQHGDDIIATRAGMRLVVEAKGEGSSKRGTKRHGKVFTRGQVGSHVSVAVLRALRVRSTGGAVPGLAFPDNAHHREQVGQVWPALSELGIVVFWVRADRAVEVQASAPGW